MRHFARAQNRLMVEIECAVGDDATLQSEIALLLADQAHEQAQRLMKAKAFEITRTRKQAATDWYLQVVVELYEQLRAERAKELQQRAQAEHT